MTWITLKSTLTLSALPFTAETIRKTDIRPWLTTFPLTISTMAGSKAITGTILEQAAAIGCCTTTAIEKILDQKIFVEQTYNSCLGLLRLGEKYGNDRLEAGCQRALTGYKVTYTVVRNILERNLDKKPLQTELFIYIPEHDNIRGAESYQ